MSNISECPPRLWARIFGSYWPTPYRIFFSLSHTRTLSFSLLHSSRLCPDVWSWCWPAPCRPQSCFWEKGRWRVPGLPRVAGNVWSSSCRLHREPWESRSFSERRVEGELHKCTQTRENKHDDRWYLYTDVSGDVCKRHAIGCLYCSRHVIDYRV